MEVADLEREFQKVLVIEGLEGLEGPRGRVVTGLDDGANEGACVDGACFEACVLPGPAADVQIRRVSGPAGNRNVSGTAPDAAPGFYKVVLYAKTDSWYIQPFVGSELPISPAGNWRATHVKPGNLYAWLVRSDFAPPAVLYSPLAVDGRLVVAGDA